jgi:hypothetical protein
MIKKLAPTIRPVLLAPALLLLSTGFTECENFTEVTVPASDTSKPNTYDGVWIGGQYVSLAATGNSFQYHIDPGEGVLAISSAIDHSGVKKLEMYSGWRYTCCSGSVCSTSAPLSVPQTEEQAGGIGSTVSDGIWLYAPVQVPTCSSGFTLSSFGFSWWTVAEDFHGNRSVGRTQSIVYP